MTKNRAHKKAARARKEATGEPYAEAHRQVAAPPPMVGTRISGQRINPLAHVTVISGPSRSGKTTRAVELCNELIAAGQKVRAMVDAREEFPLPRKHVRLLDDPKRDADIIHDAHRRETNAGSGVPELAYDDTTFPSWVDYADVLIVDEIRTMWAWDDLLTATTEGPIRYVATLNAATPEDAKRTVLAWAAFEGYPLARLGSVFDTIIHTQPLPNGTYTSTQHAWEHIEPSPPLDLGTVTLDNGDKVNFGTQEDVSTPLHLGTADGKPITYDLDDCGTLLVAGDDQTERDRLGVDAATLSLESGCRVYLFHRRDAHSTPGGGVKANLDRHNLTHRLRACTSDWSEIVDTITADGLADDTTLILDGTATLSTDHTHTATAAAFLQVIAGNGAEGTVIVLDDQPTELHQVLGQYSVDKLHLSPKDTKVYALNKFFGQEHTSLLIPAIEELDHRNESNLSLYLPWGNQAPGARERTERTDPAFWILNRNQ